MRIGDKTPPPDEGVEILPPTASSRRVLPDIGGDMVTLGEDLYGILCELLDSVPTETQLAIAMAFQARPHPPFAELGEDVRAAFEAGAAAFDDDSDDDEENLDDDQDSDE